jgi:hypothetical protein
MKSMWGSKKSKEGDADKDKEKDAKDASASTPSKDKDASADAKEKEKEGAAIDGAKFDTPASPTTASASASSTEGTTSAGAGAGAGSTPASTRLDVEMQMSGNLWKKGEFVSCSGPAGTEEICMGVCRRAVFCVRWCVRESGDLSPPLSLRSLSSSHPRPPTPPTCPSHSLALPHSRTSSPPHFLSPHTADTAGSSTWTERYFVLKDGFLLYYPERKTPMVQFDMHAKGCVPLDGVEIETVRAGPSKNMQAAIRIAHPSFGNKSFLICAHTDEERDKWLTALQNSRYV